MKPLSLSMENAMTMIPDFHRRLLADEARKCAEQDLPIKADWRMPATYWDAWVIEHERLVWMEAYRHRRDRLARMRKPNGDERR